MNRFEIVKRFAGGDLEHGISLPSRATAGAAGYDFEVAEDTLVPSVINLFSKLPYSNTSYTLDDMTRVTKTYNVKPTLVPTGIKCKLDDGYFLELSVRSSLPLKSWLILANGQGIIDADYYENESNDGEIMFQLINISPYDIQLRKGDRIGQGIIRHYELVEGDSYTNGAVRKGGFGSTSNQITTPIEPKFLQHCPMDKHGNFVVAGYDLALDDDEWEKLKNSLV